MSAASYEFQAYSAAEAVELRVRYFEAVTNGDEDSPLAQSIWADILQFDRKMTDQEIGDSWDEADRRWLASQDQTIEQPKEGEQ